MSVCLSAGISQKPYIETLRNFLYMLTVAVARAICPPLTTMQYSTELNEHLWTQVLKHLNVHIYLVTSVYQVLQST